MKAILLFLVIFGHTYMPPVEADLARYLIYSVHMPAFLFISGYLLRAERLRDRSFPQLLGYYWTRMLAAWLVVSLLRRALMKPDASWAPADVWHDVVVNPPFHLWYVPAMMVGVVIMWAVVRTKQPALWAGTIALVTLLGTDPMRAALGGLPFDRRYIALFAFFAFGFMVRNGWVRTLPVPWALAFTAVGALGRIVVFSGARPLDDLSWLVVTLGVTSLIPPAIEWLRRPLPVVGPALVLVGTYSLWVYLLHPFITQGTLVPALRGPVHPIPALVVTLLLMGVSALVGWIWQRFVSRRAAGPGAPRYAA